MTHNNIIRLFAAVILVGALMLLSACSSHYAVKQNNPPLKEAREKCEKEVRAKGDWNRHVYDACMEKAGWKDCPALIPGIISGEAANCL